MLIICDDKFVLNILCGILILWDIKSLVIMIDV